MRRIDGEPFPVFSLKLQRSPGAVYDLVAAAEPQR
jgi:hypothetical protein